MQEVEKVFMTDPVAYACVDPAEKPFHFAYTTAASKAN